MKISVLGCGRWGSFLAWYTNKIGHKVTVWGREGSRGLEELKAGKSEYVSLGDNVSYTHSLQEAINASEIVLIAISAQHLRELARTLNTLDLGENKTIVLCMKGLEVNTGKRLSVVFKEECKKDINMAVWLGPGHVQDFVRGIPNCMIIGSEDIETTKYLVERLSSELVRFYYGQDMIGNEVGAAAKNVIGIAAGILDGLGYGSLKGALMARAPKEISKLIRVMGGNDITAFGLTHLGDYEATLFSEHSNNRKYGEAFVRGIDMCKLAEGVATTEALKKLGDKYHIELPICNAVYRIIKENEEAEIVVKDLFERPIKFEF